MLFSQDTQIFGAAAGAEGKRIRITVSGDGLTNIDKLLSTAEVDMTGKFSVSLKLSKTTDATLSINFHTAEIFLEPGKKYDLQISPMNYDDYSETDPFIQSQNLEVTFRNASPNELNTLIGKFNSIYNSFLLDNFNALYRDRKKGRIDSLRVTLDREFGLVENPYFTGYITYKLASLEQMSQYYNAAQLARKYLIDKPVLYENPEYMDFFNNYFSKYITVTSIPLHKIDFRPLLTTPDPVKAMMNALATDTILKNDQLRELVLLKGLMEFYSLAGYDQKAVISVLQTIQLNAANPGSREVAANILCFLNRLTPGSEAPEFTLTDRNGKEISLKNYRGKPLLLCFWTTWCEECLTELDLMVPLYEKYKVQLPFLCISADKYLSKMILFINLKKDYTWDFANIGDRLETLIDYEVRSYPLFVLIDSEGKIFRYPAGSPSGDLEAQINQLIKE